ncbi:hypothetical protein MJ_0344 [Methanocaldococcus jannaschii DSM 2661]|uniref:Uncharacterized protein MJ0344 n=1 Tax=Methanocaldococcus jannaschii (strain ATCC 43067 / DSM 2661 / JAL-1 / JCM 10045 / NBRC 100440) TaxID=243232 RepID=Y344_METJA|nr:hypothetical protein [Methanocaldococcus jannaschii]Q57790.1 RecName: Full=Uncharacterized protein MJ0344 [Methanocaldococcus jannaschii DSM 2661]AAB98334.1 hypothetical protein MJ_0344 [Methanocaldococcus jannaschii DSM 2661]
MAVLASSTEPEPTESLLQQTNELLIIGKGAIVYKEFTTGVDARIIDSQTIGIGIPFNYYPFMCMVLDDAGNGIPMQEFTSAPGSLTVKVAATLDSTKTYKIIAFLIGDSMKIITSIQSQSGTVTEIAPGFGIFKVIYNDTEGTDTLTINYDDGTSETITVDKSNLWTVLPMQLPDAERVA